MLDELEHDLRRLRAYRAGTTEPDEATVREARDRLMQMLDGEAAAAAQQRRGRPTRERLRKLQRRRRLALAGTLATVGVGIAGALGMTTATAPVSALAAQMNRLAGVAANQDWSGIPGPGQYLYTESEAVYDIDDYVNSQTCVIAAVHHRQIWIAADGSGALNDVESGFRFTSASDQAQCASMGVTDPSSPSVVGTNDGGSRFPPGGLSFPTSDWRSLSTDPAKLLTQIHEKDGGPETPAELFTNVADFMRESDVPPVIRAALYQATALIPGVRLLGPTRTHGGQSGLGVAFYASGEPTHAMIFDQSTGRMLGELYYDQSGDVVSWADYLQQKIVDSLPDFPLTQTVNLPAGSVGQSSPAPTQAPQPGMGTSTTPPPSTSTNPPPSTTASS